jgi:hypothetical protein
LTLQRIVQCLERTTIELRIARGRSPSGSTKSIQIVIFCLVVEAGNSGKKWGVCHDGTGPFCYKTAGQVAR